MKISVYAWVLNLSNWEPGSARILFIPCGPLYQLSWKLKHHATAAAMVALQCSRDLVDSSFGFQGHSNTRMKTQRLAHLTPHWHLQCRTAKAVCVWLEQQYCCNIFTCLVFHQCAKQLQEALNQFMEILVSISWRSILCSWLGMWLLNLVHFRSFY